jgi:hypothetical protein
MSFIAIVNSFKGWDAVFFKLDERMVDLLTFLICISSYETVLRFHIVFMKPCYERRKSTVV